MATLKIKFQYTPQLIENFESKPTITFWVVHNGDPQLQRINPMSDTTVSFKIGENSEADSMLHMQVFCFTRNDRDEPASNVAGYNCVPLQELFADRQKPITLPLKVFNAESRQTDTTKGTIVLTAYPQNPIGQKLFAPIHDYTICKRNEDRLIKNLVECVESSHKVYETYSHTFNTIEHLIMPMWQYGKNFQVPGAAFGMVRARHSSEEFWLNLFAIASRREYQKLELPAAKNMFLKFADDYEVMKIVSKMHAIYANMTTYLRDAVPIKRSNTSIRSPHDGEVNGNYTMVSMEEFSCNIRARNPPAGDCEDSGALQMLESMEILNRKDWKSPIMQKIAAVRSKYVCVLALKGVNGAQYSDGTDSQNLYKNLGGHMDAMYIPQEKFCEMCAKMNNNRPIFNGIQAMSNLGNVSGNSNKNDANLSTIFTLEGTGLIDPAAEPNKYLDMPAYRLLVSDCKAFQNLKFIAPQSRTKPNAFYRVVQEVICPDLFEQYAVGHFVVMNTENNKSTIGADYLDFVNQKAHVSLLPMPEYTEAQILTIKQILKHSFPVMPLELEGTVEENIQHPLLENMRHVVKNRIVSEDDKIADFFARDDQITEENVSAWIENIKKKPGIVGFRYYCEPVSKGVRGWLLRYNVHEGHVNNPIFANTMLGTVMNYKFIE